MNYTYIRIFINLINQDLGVISMTSLTPEELLTTTRAVRKRLDLEKPVEIELVKKCIEIAQQAPTASNRQN